MDSHPEDGVARRDGETMNPRRDLSSFSHRGAFSEILADVVSENKSYVGNGINQVVKRKSPPSYVARPVTPILGSLQKTERIVR